MKVLTCWSEFLSPVCHEQFGIDEYDSSRTKFVVNQPRCDEGAVSVNNVVLHQLCFLQVKQVTTEVGQEVGIVVHS